MGCFLKVRASSPVWGEEFLPGASLAPLQSPIFPLLAGSNDSLSTSKSPPGKNSLGLDNSLSTSSEVGTARKGQGGGTEESPFSLVLPSPCWKLATERIGYYFK